MRKEEIECIGVDVSKNTLDVALFPLVLQPETKSIRTLNNS